MSSMELDEADGAGARADCHQSSEDSDDDGMYCFESDHLALKGNKDYQKLLRTLVVLESQKQQAINDLDSLLECQKVALQDPIRFVKNLQDGVNMSFPQPVKIAKMPEIDWDNYIYGSGSDQFNLEFLKPMTRGKKGGFETASVVSDTADSESVSASSMSQLDSQLGDIDTMTVIRGRIKDETKPETFNQLWTVEEQKRLEDFLVKYPPEEVEAKRWQKIATALGNRSTAQVASRVQKYFIKLARAGLPVPGRVPNMTTHNKKMTTHKHQRHNKFYYQPSTFMQAYEPPVYMSDDEEGGYVNETNHVGDVSDDETVPVRLRNTNEYQELMKLKRIRKQRLQDVGADSGIAHHVGYKCDKCECEPILGVRWHCEDCPNELAIDLCQECIDSPFETASHNSSHRMNPIHFPQTQGFLDKDYTKFSQEGYNYLDPNFMPSA
ncbi:ZZ-type zinc finger-containing protein 3-like [Lineus longissimus]|uniref:ZZ-type zinc finger-containing protein 3-like n=1 Tax=Lineus longissimus TaxID=88925 RepID=UPI002B4DC747